MENIAQQFEESTANSAVLSAYAVSYVTEAISFLLVAFGMPPELRALVDAVIGAAAGSAGWFECPDTRLSKRMWPKQESDEARKQKLRRWRKELVVWQEDNVTVVRYDEGYKIGDVRHPTKWQVLILPLIVETLQKAACEPDWHSQPSRAIQRAASKVASRERLKLLTPPKRSRRPRRQPATDQFLKMSIGNALRYWQDSPDPVAAFRKFQAESQAAFELNFPDQLRTLEITQVVDSKESGEGYIFDTLPPIFDDPKPAESFIFDTPESEGRVSDLTHPQAESPKAGSALPVIQSLASEDEAMIALQAFSSVGVESPVQVLLLNDATKKPHWSLPNPSEAVVSASIEKWLHESENRKFSLIFRMVGTGSAQLVQLDDCDLATTNRLRHLCFLQVQTSPKSYHCWLAIDCPADRFLSIRDRILRQLGTTGANGGSYGSMRWSGSRNWKPERKGYFIECIYRKLGRFVTEAELQAADLLAAEQKRSVVKVFQQSMTGWRPDYQKELDHFNGDRSRADASYACIELKAGWSKQDVKQHLLEVSEKANRRTGEKYVDDTVEHAAAKVNL